MILLIIGFIFLICGVILFYQANKIKINKDKKQEHYHKNLQKQINQLKEQKNILFKEKDKTKDELEKLLIEWHDERSKEIQNQIKKEEQLANQTIKHIRENAEKTASQITSGLQEFTLQNKIKKEQIQNEISKLKSALNAGVQARLREQEEQDKINFYKLSINEADLSDVKLLENLKTSFHKPVVLSKLIWSQYFQKQTKELCDRVVGKDPVSGIYKITNLLTKQCYIGQSVNIQERIKQHCKCGLGIDASATNKLYNSMQKDGIWNFSFEVLEKCPKEQLNEKESFWIDMYSSDIYGYNGNKGVTT